MLRVFIVQHAEKQRLPDDPGLTPLGHRQAAATARWLAAQENLVAIWASPMRRASETAAAIATELGLEAVFEDRLRERTNWTSTDDSFEELLDEWSRTIADRSYRPRRGDSSEGAAQRFLSALDDLLDAHPEGTAIVVSHGGVTADVLRTLLGDEEVTARAPDVVREGVPPCAITTLRATDDGLVVDAIASSTHMP